MIDLQNDRQVLAATLWGEARGEGVLGMECVAAVIMNRVHIDLGHDDKPDWWGEGVLGVCLKAWQFSCWNTVDPNRQKLLALSERDPWFVHGLAIADRAIDGTLIDMTAGATHYVRDDYVSRTNWTVDRFGVPRVPCAKQGRHWFYKLA